MTANPATLPAKGDEDAKHVCPNCRRTREASFEPPSSGSIPLCPKHGLAYVDVQELSACDHDPLLGATIVGRFTILGRLGRGSMGAVYRARQNAVGRDVALKIVRPDRAYDPETKKRFEREARAISLLTSPHTITAFDFGEAEDGSWFLAMEMLEGETVGERLRREGRIAWKDAVRFARDALRSLSEAHSKGIIHRDLKPDNLFLARLPKSGARREICKVLDFGIAKWQGANDGKIDQLETQAGTVFGTPRYMSPEQAQGAPLDARSDLYSLGVLLYQMVSGRAPFVDDDAVVVMARHIKDEPPPLAEVAPEAEIPANVEAVIRRALAKSPEARPQSADQMRFELERVNEGAQSFASGIQPAQPFRGQHRALSRWFVRLLPVALATGLAGWWWLSGQRSHDADSNTSSSASDRNERKWSGQLSGDQQASETSREEISTFAPPSNSGAESTQPRPRKIKARPAASSPLPRKGNERYGRFD